MELCRLANHVARSVRFTAVLFTAVCTNRKRRRLGCEPKLKFICVYFACRDIAWYQEIGLMSPCKQVNLLVVWKTPALFVLDGVLEKVTVTEVMSGVVRSVLCHRTWTLYPFVLYPAKVRKGVVFVVSPPSNTRLVGPYQVKALEHGSVVCQLVLNVALAAWKVIDSLVIYSQLIGYLTLDSKLRLSPWLSHYYSEMNMR
jgi:hypothetical protein